MELNKLVKKAKKVKDSIDLAFEVPEVDKRSQLELFNDIFNPKNKTGNKLLTSNEDFKIQYFDAYEMSFNYHTFLKANYFPKNTSNVFSLTNSPKLDLTVSSYTPFETLKDQNIEKINSSIVQYICPLDENHDLISNKVTKLKIIGITRPKTKLSKILNSITHKLFGISRFNSAVTEAEKISQKEFLNEIQNNPSKVLPKHVYSKFDLDNSKLKEVLIDKNLSPELVDKFISSYDRNIQKLESLTQKTLSGMTGGGVGRVYFEDSIDGFIFKIEKDELSSFKSTYIPNLIHKAAQTDNYTVSLKIDGEIKNIDLAKLLAKRIPKPLTEKPIENDGYYISISEDKTFSGYLLNPEEHLIFQKYETKGLDSQIIEKLWVTALYHEVVTKAADSDKEKNKIFKKPEILRFYTGSDLLKSWNKDKSLNIDYLIDGFKDLSEEQEINDEKISNTVLHSDTKWDNWGKYFRYLFDTGGSHKGNTDNDIAKIAADRPDMIYKLNDYINAYNDMRRIMDKEYSPNKNQLSMTKKKIEYNAKKYILWCKNTDRPEMIPNLYNTLNTLSETKQKKVLLKVS